MTPAIVPAYIGVDEYLVGEEKTDVRHEYLDGVVHAMAGGTEAHNLICINLVAAFRQKLRGGRCRAFMADMKLRLSIAGKDIFYYPDLMVVCTAPNPEANFTREPRLIVEVMSEGTERIDRGEKLFSYMQIPSLEEYILVAQDSPEVTLFRRSNQWKPQVTVGLGGAFDLPSIEHRILLRDIYDGVVLAAR